MKHVKSFKDTSFPDFIHLKFLFMSSVGQEIDALYVKGNLAKIFFVTDVTPDLSLVCIIWCIYVHLSLRGWQISLSNFYVT